MPKLKNRKCDILGDFQTLCKCPKGNAKTYDLENVCPWDKNTYRTMYRMYLGQAHGKMYYFSVIYLH